VSENAWLAAEILLAITGVILKAAFAVFILLMWGGFWALLYHLLAA
jgi:hypothetical protein